MALRGTYLVLRTISGGGTADSIDITADSTTITADTTVGGGDQIIAESVDVSTKIKAKPLDVTTQQSGQNSPFIPGKITVALAGGYLLATSSSNFERLYDYQKTGDRLDVNLYYNGEVIITGDGVIKKLSLRGSNSKDLITGTFGIVVKRATVSESITSYTADTTEITADTTIITADAA